MSNRIFLPKKIIPPAAAFLMLLCMTGAAVLLREKEIIFPEMAALTAGFWISPRQAWRAGKGQTVVLMTAGALAGVAAVRYGTAPLPVLLTGMLLFAAAMLTLSGSTLLPVISACVLPVLLGTESLVYPAAVLVMTTAIAAGRILLEKNGLCEPPDTAREREPAGAVLLRWGLIASVFIPLCTFACVAGLPFLIAPPLLVTFAALTAPDCPARSVPLRVFAAVVLSGAAGAYGRLLLEEKAGLPLLLTAALILLAAYAVSRLTRLLFPPAGAAAMLPLLLPAGKLSLYTPAVAAGAAVMIPAALLIGLAVKKVSASPVPAAEKVKKELTDSES